jgi:hypothetical protein
MGNTPMRLMQAGRAVSVSTHNQTQVSDDQAKIESRVVFWQSAAWWVNPLAIVSILVVPAVLIPFAIPAEVFLDLWGAPKVIDPDFLVIAVACLVGLLLGLSMVLRSPTDVRASFSADAPAVQFLARIAPKLFVITVLAYGIWLSIGIARGVNLASSFSTVVTGQATDFSAIKGPLTPVGGVTTFMQLGPVVASIYVLRHKLGMRRSRGPILILLLLSAGRALLYAERLAFLEVLSAILITSVLLTTNDRPHQVAKARGARTVRLVPFVAPFALAGLFGVTEAGRSWASHYASTGVGFWGFIGSRLGGYYATAVNNSALLVQNFDSPHVPLYSISWFWNLPLLSSVSPFASVAGNDPTVGWISFLGRISNPEFNNVGMLSLVWDYGPYLAPVAFMLFGIAMAEVFNRARRGSVVAVVGYASLFVGLMDLPRYFYVGQGRAFPIIGVCLLLGVGARSAERRHSGVA